MLSGVFIILIRGVENASPKTVRTVASIVHEIIVVVDAVFTFENSFPPKN